MPDSESAGGRPAAVKANMNLSDDTAVGAPGIDAHSRRADHPPRNYDPQLEAMREDFERKVQRIVTDEIRTRMNNLLKNTAVIVGLLGGLGFIGLITKTIPDTVEARVKSTVDTMTLATITSVKERTDAMVDELKKQTAKIQDEIKQGAEATVKDVKDSSAALVEDVKRNAADVKTLKEQLHAGSWIVLQTDYGDQDAYMGALKGAILCEDPSLRIETITSENPEYDIGSASGVLADAAQHYPPGTVFLILVNPGAVVSDPIVLHTKNDLYFVGYDNGCLDAAARQFGVDAVRIVTNAHRGCNRAEAVGNAFTWLAPTAAWIARAADAGKAYAEVGGLKAKYEFKLPEPSAATLVNGRLRGEVSQFDRFGNVRTNIPADLVRQSGLQNKDSLRVKVGDQEVTCPLVERYGDVDAGRPLCVIANGYLQFAVNRDSFRNLHKVKRGASVEVVHALIASPK